MNIFFFALLFFCAFYKLVFFVMADFNTLAVVRFDLYDLEAFDTRLFFCL